ncbi:hypothetical protein ACWXWB_22240 [Pantoea dispersa]|uniref:hypothetical protein n=1 Tax=Pantoea dispersa TaxID=59814 RepID=UPI002DBCD52F|nr:hypothetical protein [Pantoea dispersa]MEB5972857.1 hypothetical protein [Pantoea dispersa]
MLDTVALLEQLANQLASHCTALPQRDRKHSVALAAPPPRQNKCFADKIGATLHPPAGFASEKFFSFIFLQTATPGCATTDFVPEYAN